MTILDTILDKDGIKLDNRIGKWYVIDAIFNDPDGIYYALLEHETYGEDAGHILCRVDNVEDGPDMTFEEICETWDSIEDTLDDLGIEYCPG